MGRLKKPRWEDNEISPSKYRSPTRYVEALYSDYDDRAELCWDKSESDLTERQIKKYVDEAKHIPEDAALSILRDNDYDTKLALEQCKTLARISDLSHLEEKVLLAANPVPCPLLGIRNKPPAVAESHVVNLLPHVQSSVIRNHYNHLGREGFIPTRGWPKGSKPAIELAYLRLAEAGLVSKPAESPLYPPGKRALRSSALTPEDTDAMPRRLGKGNNLAIAMVGFSQRKTGEEDSSPDRRPVVRALPFNHQNHAFRAVSCTPNIAVDDRLSRENMPKRGRGRPRKNPPSLLLSPQDPLGISSSRANTPPPSASSSSSASPSSSNGTPKKRRSPLDINMIWQHPVDAVRTRRPSLTVLENALWTQKKKEKVDANGNDGPSTSSSPSNGHSDGPSTSRLPAGAERKNERASSVFGLPERRNTRSSSVFSSATLQPRESIMPFTPPARRSRDNLAISMVGWNQPPAARDRDGFVIPPLPARTLRSPIRSRQPTPSPPASPEI